ncbi:MAG: DUF4405 domain-containing protein [Clostridia bacterium]
MKTFFMPKTKLIIKILLDVTMFLMFLFLMFGLQLGASFFSHELLGVLIGILYLLHIALNFNFIKKIFKGKIKTKKDKFNLITDALLLLGMATVITTGILMSRELFLIETNLSIYVIFNIHNIGSYLCLAILLSHVILHSKYLVASFKHIAKNSKFSYAKRVYAVFVCCLIMLVFAYKMIWTINSSDSILQENQDYELENSSEELPTEYIIQTSDGKEVVLGYDAPTSDEDITLEDLLNRLTCKGCSKRCLLISPLCRQGTYYAETVEEQFNA